MLLSMIVGWSMGWKVIGIDEQVEEEKFVLELLRLSETLRGIGWKVSDKSFILSIS